LRRINSILRKCRGKSLFLCVVFPHFTGQNNRGAMNADLKNQAQFHLGARVTLRYRNAPGSPADRLSQQSRKSQQRYGKIL